MSLRRGRSHSVRTTFLGLALALGLILVAAPASSAVAATLSGTVTGQAPGQEVEPLAEAIVTATDSETGEEIGSTYTDIDGKYSLDAPAGILDVKFVPAPGPFEATTIHKVEVSGSLTLNVALSAIDSLQLTGSLSTAGGDPVGGRFVFLSGSEGQSFNTKTDSEGNFSFSLLPGTYSLSFNVPTGGSGSPGLPQSWIVGTEQFELESDRNLNLVLPGVSTLTVEALDQEDEPISEALVAVPMLNASGDLGDLEATNIQTRELIGKTDAQGRVSFTVFTGSSWSATGGSSSQSPSITPPVESGYAYTTFEVPAVDQDTTMAVHLAHAIQLTGSLSTAGGDPVGGRFVFLSGSEGQSFNTKTDSEGNFSFSLLPGTYSLSFNVPTGGSGSPGLPQSWIVGTEQFELESDRNLNLVLPGVSTLTVEALDQEDEPISEALVAVPMLNASGDLGDLEATNIQTRELIGKTDAQGRVSFTVFTGSSWSATGGSSSQSPSITPPVESGYAYTTFEVPAVDQDTTMAVHLAHAIQLTGSLSTARGDPGGGTAFVFLSGNREAAA